MSVDDACFGFRTTFAGEKDFKKFISLVWMFVKTVTELWVVDEEMLQELFTVVVPSGLDELDTEFLGKLRDVVHYEILYLKLAKHNVRFKHIKILCIRIV
jgi:hypothetical protein